MTAFVGPSAPSHLFPIYQNSRRVCDTHCDTRREWIFDVMESENPIQRDEMGGSMLQSDQH